MPWYEWLFDGVGGAAAIAIVGFLVRRISKSQAETPSISANLDSVSDSTVAIGTNVSQIVHHHHVPDRPSDALKATEPSPSQIISDLKALPPFGKYRAQESYRGLSVLWPLILLEVDQPRGAWAVFFRSFEEWCSHPPIVYAPFTELPPEMKVSPTGTLVWVRGRIRAVDRVSISLEADPEIVEVKRP